MARKSRIEIEGGLHHVITRGKDLQTIFHSDEDHTNLLSILSGQKRAVTLFYLYA